jgi:hypothetical protein
VDWFDVEVTAVLLAAFALAHGMLASLLRRDTRVLPAAGETHTLES